MVKRHGQRGYTLMEISVVLALFGVFLFIIVTLTAEMRRQEKKYPVDLLSNPQVDTVLARSMPASRQRLMCCGWTRLPRPERARS